MNKLRQILVMMALALPAAALADVVTGSIDFNNPLLWGKAVTAGFDDDGNTTGETHWQIGAAEGSAVIYRKNGESAGYIRTKTETDLHRTMPALKPAEIYDGPAAAGGREIPTEGLFIDTTIAIQPHPVLEVRTASAKDKINCWLYIPEDGSQTNFVITAGKLEIGGAITPVNYVTDTVVYPGREFQLTIRAIANACTAIGTMGEEIPGYVGFEVRVDGEIVSANGQTIFPSLVAPTEAYGKKMYSFGVSGAATMDCINFTKDDPKEKPEYDKDDVSMLREYSTIRIDGFPEIGVSPLTNFPLLVRLSEESVKGFRYSRCLDNGGDIRFTDENGKVLPCEIDTWNPDGETLIWVKVPFFLNGKTLTMHWGLKDDGTPPENDSSDVWSEYVGVWHLGDCYGVSYRDSTGRGHDARAIDGRLKLADEELIGPAGQMDSGSLVTTIGDIKAGELEDLTFTGWYRGIGVDTNGCRMIAGSKYGAATHEEMKAGDGWSLHLHEKSETLLYQDTTGQQDGAEMAASLIDNWTFLGLSVGTTGNHGGTRRYACSGATLTSADCWTQTETNRYSVVSTNAVLLLPAGFMGDELRLTRKIRSFDWVRTEHDQVTNRAYCSYGIANVKGTDNFWLREPSITPNSAPTEEAASIVVDPGEPRFGIPFVRFYDEAGNLLASQPVTAGRYRAVFIVNKGVRNGLEKELSFVIFDQRAYRKIDGFGRVMLFNSDATPECPVTLQGYYDVDSQTNKVWLHEGTRWTGTGRFVLSGNRHVYYEPETGKKLWEFRNARLGNLFQDDDVLVDRMNFLPWGGYARRFDDSERPANAQRYAGTLILQNKSLKSSSDGDPAAAYSPMFEKGVGTIYFDAVNSCGDYPNVIKLQVCGTAEGSSGVQVGKWSDVKVDVFAISNGVYNAAMSAFGTDEISLSMAHIAGSTNWFYRVRAQIDTNMPVRVRIVRNDDTDNWDGGLDDDGLVEIDNIIVSYPAMGIAISQFGAPAEPDNTVLRGQRAPFDVAFPSANDLGKLHALVRVNYIVNNTNEIDSSFVGSMMLTYRWRYLNQKIGDWKELTLSASANDPERFVSSGVIEGEGTGDIEYYASAVVNAPFYSYWDYSGFTGWVWPDGFSERRGDVKINAREDGVYSETNLSPALGTDYFIRLREGASDYEGWRLHLKRTNGAADDTKTKEEVVEMRLSDEHTWRGLYTVATNGLTNVYYRVEAYNLQPTTGGVYQWNTNWYAGASQTDLPANDVLEASDGTVWTRLPTDELTGYIMFQLEDTTRSVSIIHADYQDFNAWSDANTDEGYFLGTSTAVPTSGVSRTVKSFGDSFGLWTETIATNILWYESFDLPGEQVVSTTGTWAINQPFTGAERTTPNGWTAANGMWVSERYSELGGKSFALQMKGEGYGTVMMPQLLAPRGLHTFRFDARVSQTYDSHPFNYYVGTTNDVYNYTDYTFAVPCAMESEDDGTFSGVGTVSAVARYRDSKGGYEVRVERINSSQVEMSLYKWMADGSARLLGTSPVKYPYAGTANCCLDAADGKLGALFISCENAETSVWITAGLMARGQAVERSLEMSGWTYYKIGYEDAEEDQYRSGTCGVGSKNCPATFVRPVLSFNPVDRTKAGSWLKEGDLYYWKSAETVFFADESVILGSEEEYDSWNSYTERLPAKVDGDFPTGYFGFKAKSPEQVVVIEASTHLQNRWTEVATNAITSFGFSTYETDLYLTDDVDVRLRTGRGTGSSDVVVDNLFADQWRGEDYDDANNPDRTGAFYFEVDYGAPTNFVYTTAWIAEDGAAEISPMRTTADAPSGIRAPLMDGEKNNTTDGSVRGIGLGQFTFSYRDADRRARLIVQVWTNNVTRTRLSSRTESVSSEYWTDVKVYDFSTMTADELKTGLISCYVGLHGVKGVMRVIVDPALVAEAQDPTINPTRDPAYGRIYITSAGAKDNPVLDSGSWWGWNLRTTDEAQRQTLEDGSYDARTWGQAFALNNSIEAGIRVGDVYDTHKPFLQTPILTRGAIGEVSFRARKYDAGDATPSVAIYGMKDYDPAAKDEAFEFLTNIVITSERYRTYTYMAPVSENYTAFRLAVTGVDGIVGDGSDYSEDDPPAGPTPYTGKVRRVLLDEVAVFEAIKARLGFCKVGAFRSHLNDNGVIANMPCKEEQPLCNESWGIQTELYAVRLSERIDYERAPEVTLHWYVGHSPWGYDQWATNPAACSAKLSKADGATNLVYRSSYLASPDAVLPMQTKAGSIVQFSLEVVYYMVGQEVALTNTLSSTDWAPPEWFNPVNYNTSLGKGKHFSAFTILDEVSPGWAWINEINLFGAYQKYVNTDKNNQYIEIAAPAEANLTGWSIRLLETQPSTDSVITNQLVTFGKNGLSGTKSIGSESNMVFHVVANAGTRDAGKWKAEDGRLDGVWSVQTPTSFVDANGVITFYRGMGFQLVRKTGVVEHEVVAIGTNLFERYSGRSAYFPSNVVTYLNEHLSGARFFVAGSDDNGLDESLGVVTSQGEGTNNWTNAMEETPGRINENQQINPEHPTPNGSSITVYANLAGAHIYQTVGEAVRTNLNQIVIIRKGSALGTNITYHIDEWYELKDVGVTEGGTVWTYEPSQREVTVNVARNCSNNTITVTAAAQVDKRLRDLGVTDQNRYTPAIIDWLEKRSMLKDVYGTGTEWPDSDGNVYLADFMGLNRQVITNMTLTEMYWLDICPTISNQVLVAGMSKPPLPETLKEGYDGTAAVTNINMSVFMMISNCTENALSPYYGKAWAPYVIRGLDPGVSSWDYSLEAPWSWSNATFKVTGILANGLTSEKLMDNWVSLRYFVFKEDSFDENFTTDITVAEPHSPRSLGYQMGWGEWFRTHPDDTSPIFFSWSIDTRLVPVTVEILKKENP